ncbi:MAG: histidine kinase [Roseiflexus castenholzii]|uniref:GAF domain-containing protein n=1 Tax=Roseiflexus castenholzii TaxID=120962 RepID=UPI000CAF7149|nr:MAG: histidine kinase [Roseiflexus castenholzii]
MTITQPLLVGDVLEQPINEAEQRSEVLANLLDVSTYLVSVLNPNELFTGLVRRVVEVVPAVQAGLLWIYDQRQTTLHLESFYGLDVGPACEAIGRLRLRPGEGLAGEALRRGEPLLIETRSSYRDLARRVSPRSEPDVCAFLECLPCELTAVVLPLRIGAEVIGILELMNLGNRPQLRRTDLQVLQTFSNLAAGAIKNAQLHAQMKAHQRRLEAFGAIGTVISTAADLDELLRNVLDVVLGVVDASVGILLLLDPGRAMLQLGAWRNIPHQFVEQHREIHVVGAMCEEAVRYGQPIRRPLIAGSGEDTLIDDGLASCAYIPLLAGGTVVGVIGIYGDPALPERIDVQTLMMMSNLIGFAIANVRLYQESHIERRKLTAVINSIVEGVVLCDRLGRLVLANRMAMELLSSDTFPYQQPISAMADFYVIRDLDGRALPIERLPLTRALAGEVFHDYRVLLRGASGEDTVMSFSGAPVYGDMNTIEGAVVIFRDITEHQKLERAKDDFLAVAAHELRSPLAAVRSYADLLIRREQRRDRDKDAPSDLRGLTILSQQVSHMLRLVDNLLDMSRLDAGLFSLQLQRVNLVALTHQVIDQLRPTIGERDVTLTSDAPDLLVTCDPLRIRQVLTNLLVNAARYSSPASPIEVTEIVIRSEVLATRYAHQPPPTLRSWLIDIQRTPQPLALITVRDYGIGMSEETMQRLFRRYARGRQRVGEGLGLGLYLSYELIGRHGGTIWAESVEGRGSTFYVTFPLEGPPLPHGSVQQA